MAELNLEQATELLSKKLAEKIDDIKKKGEFIPDELKNIPEEIKSMKGDIQKLEGLQKAFEGFEEKLAKKYLTGNEPQFKSTIKQVEEQLISFVEKFKGDKSAIVSSLKGQALEIRTKAVSTMTKPYTVASGSRIPTWEREAGVSKAPDRLPFVQDLISIGSTTSDTVSWIERVLREGYAGQTAEGATYSQMSETYKEDSKSAEYTTAYTKVTDKMINDVDFILSEIQTEIIDAIELTLDAQLLDGDGSSPNHKGILRYATAFSAIAGFTVPSPTVQDALRAAVLKVANNKFQANYIVMHPSDMATLETRKEANNQYVLAPFYDRTRARIAGVQIVENLGMTQGSILAGDFSKSKYFNREGLIVRLWDQAGTDPIEGKKTITGVTRGIHRIKGPDTLAFVKGTINDIITAITPA